MDALETFKQTERQIILDGQLFKGHIHVDTTTDPVISIEDFLFNRSDDVKVTQVITMVPDEGEPFVIIPKDIRGSIDRHRSVLEIDTLKPDTTDNGDGTFTHTFINKSKK